MDLSFPLSRALAPAPALQRPLEKVEISTLPPPIHGKVRQCGSYYLISIPYSLRYFNDPPCFHGPGARSPLTHGRVSTKKRGPKDLYCHDDTQHADTLLDDGADDRFSFPQAAGIHYVSSFSICPFIFRCLEMSERPCVLAPPWLRDCVPAAVGGDVLCIVLGRAACQASRMALTCFPQFLHHHAYSLGGLWQPRQTTPIGPDPKQDRFF